MGMTIGQINCFMTVVNEQSFSKAANVLFVSQPAVSKSIASLEEELGYALIDRRDRELRLTPAGAKLYDFFVRMRNEYQNTLSEINHIMNASDTTVRIGCSDVWNPDMFYGKMIRHFKRNYPSIHLEVEDNRLPDLFGRLQAGKLDIIMTYELYRPLQYGFSVQPLTDASCRILYSKAYFKSVHSLADLNGADVLIFDVDIEKKFGKLVKKICSDYGYITEVKNCSRFESAVFNMACGRGVLLITEWDNIITNTPYESIPFPHSAPVNLVYQNAPEKPYIQLVVDELVQIFALEKAKAHAAKGH
jgi:DNA-binding transcriptional LysR family regulator